VGPRALLDAVVKRKIPNKRNERECASVTYMNRVTYVELTGPVRQRPNSYRASNGLRTRETLKTLQLGGPRAGLDPPPCDTEVTRQVFCLATSHSAFPCNLFNNSVPDTFVFRTYPPVSSTRMR
jgi:hypothetical protein